MFFLIWKLVFYPVRCWEGSWTHPSVMCCTAHLRWPLLSLARTQWAKWKLLAVFETLKDIKSPVPKYIDHLFLKTQLPGKSFIQTPVKCSAYITKSEHDWNIGWSSEVLRWSIFFEDRTLRADEVDKGRDTWPASAKTTHTPTHQEQNKAILWEDSWSSTPLP